ncbi:MAG: hypothetical protein E6Q97_30340 [Desulfurellales bacterium]|nr:MAG: hypothetical protein E6Q97_30340 [Desulfurellales bacterium]
MKETPILFSGPMVRAILEGRKTQTRRVIKPQPVPFGVSSYKGSRQGWKWKPDSLNRRWNDDDKDPYNTDPIGRADLALSCECPYGQPGDRLWVRETWGPCAGGVCYRASEEITVCPDGGKWKPSIFMPRWASRITLEITDVRVERIKSISADDAEKEGCGFGVNDETGGPVARFKTLWDSINSKRGFGWDANPWVWAISFKRA